MQLLHSRNPWVFRYDLDPIINFCVWVLLLDGLRVPPFDQHPDGNGSLRALGLTEASWRAWFLRVLDPQQRKRDVEQLRQQELAAYLKASGIADVEQLRRRYQAELFQVSTDPPLPPVPEWHFYHASWDGSAAVRSRLIELQEPYKHVSRHYDVLCERVMRAVQKEEDRSGTRLYDELQLYQTRLPSLVLHFVLYDHPLDYLIPPTTVMMTVQEGQPNPQEWRSRVLAAAEELAARAGKRSRRQSPYSRTQEYGGQSTTVDRRYARKPIPPTPPPQEIPKLEDAVRQGVFEELSDEFFYGIVDFATVQFLREKGRPGWRLYEIAFGESDGEQHRQIVILQQDQDGSWRYVSGGSSVDMQQEWSKIFVPVHDHPLIFLSVNWISPGTSQYLLTAHGHVIDNGFHVERVRLVNDAGQVREDTVEDGYVFFACKPEEQVQLPMQVELYDQQGRLVWRQKIPDHGLPPWLKVRYQP